jgi:hypothetical protein
MSYSLSVVLLIPAAHRDALNQLAEAMGWGPENLTISLSGGTWYGCHTWAAPSFLGEFAQAPPEYAEALAALVMSVVEGGNPAEHWQQALLDNGLTVDEVPA